jgi:hypothetical protein
MRLVPAAAGLLCLLALAAGCTAPSGEGAAGSAAPLRNTLRWSTASEVDSYGFDVYRGDAEQGPFERINESPVPGAGTTDLPQEYEYFDTNIVAGTEYFYYIESISMTGQRERVTPTVRVVASSSDGDAEDEPQP